uniref:Small ribosomal subunit protein mS31 n=1 Tax=Nothoprocta perdicaria TaxID=30464 RepID=A0A8C6ZBU9_NOTPE
LPPFGSSFPPKPFLSSFPLFFFVPFLLLVAFMYLHQDGSTIGVKIQKLFSTSSTVLSTKEDGPTPSAGSPPKTTPESQEDSAETPKQKLLNLIGNMKVEVSSMKKFQQLRKRETNRQTETQREGLELIEAVSAVASSLPLNKKQTESDLLAQLRRHEETTDKQKKGGTVNIRCVYRMLFSIIPSFLIFNVISDMTIKKESPAQRGVRVSNLISLEFEEDGKRIKPEQLGTQSSDPRRYFLLCSLPRPRLYKNLPRDILNLVTTSSPTIWDLEFAKEIAAVTEQPPRNGFEEMIQWTKEGILWEFPIDNEAGMEDDAEFHEHIFLEKHLEDFPKQGPIRHFMELVICGLSKNPYLTVKQKIEHIEWFRKYFEEKQEFLQGI